MDARTISELSFVTKNYGTAQALRGVSLTIRPGELVALLGPNGAGKTTAVKLMLGLAAPTSGRVTLFGRDPRHREARLHTGAMLQVAKVPETLRVREHIELFSAYYPAPLPVRETIAAAGLAGLENRFFGDLSGGEKQRVLFALALCGNPKLLFLDEPTAGLDVEARRGLWEHTRRLVERGASVLLTTHYLEEADALADRVVVISGGRIAAEGTPSEIKARTAAKKVRCVTRLDAAALRRIPGAAAVQADRQRMEILTAEPERVVRELLARDESVRDLEVAASGLEEAFLALTKHDEARMREVA